MAHKTAFSNNAPRAIELHLARQLEAVRLAKNMNQTQLANEAGVSRRTITRLENGEGVSLDTLIRVMGALNIVDRLETLIPDQTVQPIDRVRLKGRSRKNARPTVGNISQPWQWGSEDEQS